MPETMGEAIARRNRDRTPDRIPPPLGWRDANQDDEDVHPLVARQRAYEARNRAAQAETARLHAEQQRQQTEADREYWESAEGLARLARRRAGRPD